MNERLVYPQWRDQDNNYPFEDGAAIPLGLSDMIVDASLALRGGGVAWLSRLEVHSDLITIYVTNGFDTISGTIPSGSTSDTVMLYSGDYVRGCLVGAEAGLRALFVLPVGVTEFATTEAPFSVRVVHPLPADGVTSLAVEDDVCVGDVVFVAEHGVRFVPVSGGVRIDVVGVPRGASTESGLRTINDIAPDSSGVFRLVSSLMLASDSALRITGGVNSVSFTVAGV